MKQAVILVGGKGERLKSVSKNLPKPMVPFLGKPLLQILIEKCLVHGFSNILLLASYKQQVIKDYFGNGEKFNVTINYCYDSSPRGTAGALIDSMKYLQSHFLLIYGDTFFDLDLNLFWNFHKCINSDVTIFLHPNDHPDDSDLIDIDSNFQVTNIYPYPHENNWRRNLVNAALYVMNKDVLKNVSLKKDNPDIAKDLFPYLLKKRKKLFGYQSTEYIKDIGTPNRLKKVENDFLSGRIKSLRSAIQKKAIFLDRDGVINKEVNHLASIDDFELLPGVAEAIAEINNAGILAVIVTNQPVIARGNLSDHGLRLIHNKMDTLLGRKGAYIDRVYYCPHHPDSGFDGEVKELKIECNCRKPEIGLFLKAKKELNISFNESWMVGDSTRDIYAAKSAGIKSILVKTGNGGKDFKYDIEPLFVSTDLKDAVDTILSNLS